MSKRRAGLILAISFVVMAGCGEGATPEQASSATGDPTTTEEGCIEQRMVSTFEVTTLADMVEMSDVVAEIEITGRREGETEHQSDASTTTLLAEARILDAVTGAEPDDSVTLAVATTTSNDRDQDVILTGESSHVTLQPGVRAIAGLRSSSGDLYELGGGVLVESGGTVEALPAATCPRSPPAGLADEADGRSVDDVLAELRRHAQETPTGG